MKNNNILCENNNIIYYPISILKLHLDNIGTNMVNEYKNQLLIGEILNNCNPNKECFELWINWLKKGKQYNHNINNIKIWNSFKIKYQSIELLKYYSKKFNYISYVKIEREIESLVVTMYDFTENYLFSTTNEKIFDKISVVSQHIINWKNSKISKSLAIKSPYNTGKTQLIKQILTEMNFERILFISYRKTLTNNLYGTFRELGITSYLDKKYDSNKLICQIESLYKILPLKLIDKNGELVIPSYDLVIIDEIESVLNHFISPTLENKKETFELMSGIIFNSRKILALDGDLNNRSYDFLKYFGGVTILNNTIKKDQRHYIFTNNKHCFDKKIENDLENNKNIVIISLSLKDATYNYEKYKNKYKCVLHCSNSDDDNKNGLKNVNEYWKNYRLVVYSPSIEAGVNCDIDHFDNIYMVFSPNSTSPRGTLQMANRVRNVKNNNIIVYLNNMPYNDKEDFVKYDLTKEYVKNICSHNNIKYVEDYMTGLVKKVKIFDENDLYTQILIHNENEKANKNNNIFISYFTKMLTDKGHTYEYSNYGNVYTDISLKEKMNYNISANNIKIKIPIHDILNSPSINNDQYKDILRKICNDQATREEKISLEKYNIKEFWNIENITEEFLNKFYGKNEILQNLRFLMGEDLVNSWSSLGGIVFDKQVKLDQITIINEIITLLGFELLNMNKKINRESFLINVNNAITKSQLFTNSIKSKLLFGLYNYKIKNIKKSFKAFMGFINTLLSDWGLKIISHRKSTSKNVSGKKITINNSQYILSYINNIDKYIKHTI